MDRSTFNKPTVTITFAESVENHVRMQQIGKKLEHGFSAEYLRKVYDNAVKNNIKAEIIELNDFIPLSLYNEAEEANVLVFRGFLDETKADEILAEQLSYDWDTQAYMYGQVRNKHARYNVCFDDLAQKADIANRKGTVIPWSQVPLLDAVRDVLPNYLGDLAQNLKAEGNLYYDPKKTGIGFHGDTERRIVIGLRLGPSIPLEYQWYHKKMPVGTRAKLNLNHGDLYVMSEKATGNDWKRSVIPTLRHAAGAKKFCTIKAKKTKQKRTKQRKISSD